MRECCGSTLKRWGNSMPRPYSDDLRERAVEGVKSGASGREVAEQFGVNPSAVIKWLRRWRETGKCGGQTKRRQRIAAGKICEMVFRPDRRAARFDVRRGDGGEEESAYSRQPQRGGALFPSPRDQR
jgi:putative transposase